VYPLAIIMGVKELIERFKEKKQAIGMRARDKREIERLERDADKYSKATAISEARQLRRESRAKHIKKEYGTYKPLSQKIKETLKKDQSMRRETPVTKNDNYQRRAKPRARKPRRLPSRNNLLSSRETQSNGLKFGIGGPNLGINTRNILTGKQIKRK